MKTTISNPPYNMKWKYPLFIQTEERFVKTALPPENNANLAFVLTALEESDRSIFILPNNALSTSNENEKQIVKYLVDNNVIDSVIMCPDKMFESTSIPVSIIVFDKNKKDNLISMIDARETFVIDRRIQKGQIGGNAHTSRKYEKKVKVFNDEIIDKIADACDNRKEIENFCSIVDVNSIKQNNYDLRLNLYIRRVEKEEKSDYKHLVKELNRIILEKNACKLTINENLAKKIGFDVEQLKNKVNMDDVNDILEKICGEKIEKENYFSTTKNMNEIKFENATKENISSIFMIVFNMWKQHIYYLNNEENRYLKELRNILTQDLMVGKIEV